MTVPRDPELLIRAFLDEGQTVLPDHVYDVLRSDIDRTRQRVVIGPWRTPDMNSFAKLAIAAAAVVAVALVGINLLPRGSNDVGGPPAPSASSSPSAPASPSASPSASADSWHGGIYDVGRYEATLGGVPFSFTVPAKGWNSFRYTGMLEKGAYPTASYAWIGMPYRDNGVVGTDPCAGKAKYVGGSVDDLATAWTTIPGTEAVGPTDTTIGGIPAKLVVLTIHPDIACAPNQFMLFGPGSNYPNALTSTIRTWAFEKDGIRFNVYSDQAGPNASLAQEIEQIVDSISFE
jgi:hypothetical protein